METLAETCHGDCRPALGVLYSHCTERSNHTKCSYQASAKCSSATNSSESSSPSVFLRYAVSALEEAIVQPRTERLTIEKLKHFLRLRRNKNLDEIKLNEK